jgi:hypothetical protein
MENSEAAAPRTGEEKISDFTDWDTWQHADSLRRKIYRVVVEFPSHEKYGLSSQIKRGASSVTANLGEGYGRYSYQENLPTEPRLSL